MKKCLIVVREMFLTAYETDVGLKKTNQDALLIKTATSSKGDVGLFVVCDGMGGLSHGELASSTVIKRMATWFDEELSKLVFSYDINEKITSTLEQLIKNLNEKIRNYGMEHQIQLGTTITGLLFIHDQYYIVHVGDSRAYKITDKIEQLTKDQTLVAREIERGNITVEQGKRDPRRNVLLQCVGASKTLQIPISTGKVEEESLYVLCSDGFYQKLTTEDMVQYLKPNELKTKEEMKEKAYKLVQMVKQRKEKDNITVLLVKVCK